MEFNSYFSVCSILLKNYFLAPFTQEMVEEAKEVITAHGLPFNYDGWTNLIKKHNGKLPLRIRAVRGRFSRADCTMF